MKQNIQKLNLCSKMDMSKTVWINVCLPVGYMWNENSNHPNFHHTCWHTELVRHTELVARCSAAKKGRSTVNYRQSLAFDRPYLSCNDHSDRRVFQEIFFIIIIFWNSSTQILFKTDASVLESGLMACNFISTSSQKTLQHRSFPVKTTNFLGAPFL